LRQVTSRLPVFLPREEALLVATPGLREDAVAAPFLAGAALFFPVFLAVVFRGGVFCWTAAAPAALQASAIMATMAV
jgi:hypothetical protein